MDIKVAKKHVDKFQLITASDRLKWTAKKSGIGALTPFISSQHGPRLQSVHDRVGVRSCTHSDMNVFAGELNRSKTLALTLADNVPIEVAGDITPLGTKALVANEVEIQESSRIVGISLDYLLSLLKTNRKDSVQ